MDKVQKFTLTTALGLALALTIGCSLPDEDSGETSSSSGANVSTPSSSSKAIEYGSLNYGGQSYKTVKIGSQTWMAENLNYNAEGSKCYGNQESNCATYGRLYNWATAMALESDCNNAICADKINAKHQGICPGGWHLPSYEEWKALASYVESQYGINTASKHLKAVSGWYTCGFGSGYSYSCEGTYGFAALPGGYGISPDDFSNNTVGYDGYWWSASEYEYDANFAYSLIMKYNFNSENTGNSSKSGLFSVRCLKD